MSLRDTVEFAHMTLGLVPEILDAVDVNLLVCEQFRMVDPEVMKIRHIEHVVPSTAIRVDNAVRDDLRINLPAALKQRKYRDFSSSAASAPTVPSPPK